MSDGGIGDSIDGLLLGWITRPLWGTVRKADGKINAVTIAPAVYCTTPVGPVKSIFPYEIWDLAYIPENIAKNALLVAGLPEGCALCQRHQSSYGIVEYDRSISGTGKEGTSWGDR